MLALMHPVLFVVLKIAVAITLTVVAVVIIGMIMLLDQ